MRYTDRPTRHGRSKPGALSFEIDDVIDRADREKVLFCEFPFSVVDNAERRSIPRDQRAGTDVLKPRMRRSIVYGPADERVRLEDIVRFGRGQKSSSFVKSVRPGQVELLQVIVSVLELAPIEGIDATPKRVIVAL